MAEFYEEFWFWTIIIGIILIIIALVLWLVNTTTEWWFWLILGLGIIFIIIGIIWAWWGSQKIEKEEEEETQVLCPQPFPQSCPQPCPQSCPQPCPQSDFQTSQSIHDSRCIDPYCAINYPCQPFGLQTGVLSTVPSQIPSPVPIPVTGHHFITTPIVQQSVPVQSTSPPSSSSIENITRNPTELSVLSSGKTLTHSNF